GRRPVEGPLDVVQFGPAQYAWRDAGAQSRPARSLPPSRFTTSAGALTLPAYSLTVVGWTEAFSSEVASGSREENASRQKIRPPDLMQSGWGSG
ncbi:hypothetical protein, partial [Caulobacter sp. D5]|uniref:hypothetical protein n=1 Tax=Caulobacter sp. D5 TaxID=357400 RepID=UPI001304B64A